MTKRIAIIPARGGSKRILNKNILSFHGKPMIAYALEAASKSNLFDLIHVSTDCQATRAIVEGLGFQVEFMRAPELCDDHTGLLKVIKWVTDQYARKSSFFETICCLLPNAPLINAQDLIKGCEIFEFTNGSRPLLTFTKFPAPIEWAFKKNSNDLMMPISATDWQKRSQDIQESYYECGPFNFWRNSHLDEANPMEFGVSSYILPTSRAIDIDTAEDLELAKQLYLIQTTGIYK